MSLTAVLITKAKEYSSSNPTTTTSHLIEHIDAEGAGDTAPDEGMDPPSDDETAGERRVRHRSPADSAVPLRVPLSSGPPLIACRRRLRSGSFII